MPITQQQVLESLRTVNEPELFKDIVTLNLVKNVAVNDTVVRVILDLSTASGPVREAIRRDVQSALAKLGATTVEIEIASPQRAPSTQDVRTSPLPQVKNIIAVGAGKGGVGKSTVAVNLAIGLQRKGAAVGLMDGDIYGPSIPTLLGIRGLQPEVRGSKISPFHVHGIHAVTIGNLVERDKPLIWRGPMAHGAFKQLILDNTEWPPLDYLIVDLPPGTGDVPLTLCQLLPLTGAVIVVTPQQVAIDDAVRAVRMFQQLNTPILGIVENMSHFIAPDGTSHDIFGRGGAHRAAQSLSVPFLGELPVFTELRVNSDAGKPHANFESNPALREALEQVTSRLEDEVRQRNLAPPTTKFTVS